MPYYAVAFLPKDSWISSYEQALRYVNVNLTFEKVFFSKIEALNLKQNSDYHTIVYTIEGDLNKQNPNKFDRIGNIHQAEFIYKADHLNFTRDTLLKELKSWMDKQERVNSGKPYSGVAQANELAHALKMNVNLSRDVKTIFDYWPRITARCIGRLVPLISVYNKYQALLFKQRSFTFECNEERPWNQGYFRKRRDFLYVFGRLKAKSDEMKASQDAPNQALQTHLDKFLDKISLIDRISYDVPFNKYWLDHASLPLPVGILPALTQAMNLIEFRLNRNISEKYFKKEVQNLKKKALILQSSTADTFEYLSYLMLAISACAIALTVASVAAPVTGLAVAGGSALLGLTFFTSSYFPPEPGAQVASEMNALSAASGR
ncbi:MAG: hypothetical protein GW760_07690 [Legionella sp.]|jgi:hypothetical protein|nr:hypothetical protein [Legionella sp.]